MKTVQDWQEYSRPRAVSVEYHRRKTSNFLTGQQANISALIGVLQPESVLCMGAGYLTDSPMEDLAAQGCAVHLADWLPDVSRHAFLHDLVQLVGERYACLVCRQAKNPTDYCGNFNLETNLTSRADRVAADATVCGNFEVDEARPPHCRAYLPGINPIFHEADVTQGRAVDFAEQIPKLIARTKPPRKSFAKAITKLRSMKSGIGVPMADGSVDLITSSMVASQFDFEPFSYFQKCILQNFSSGVVEKDKNHLKDWELEFRNDLFRFLMEGHCREIVRLLRPNGRVYFSIETAHRRAGSREWFQPETLPATLELIGTYFNFDFDAVPGILAPEFAQTGTDGTSLIQSYILSAKSPMN